MRLLLAALLALAVAAPAEAGTLLPAHPLTVHARARACARAAYVPPIGGFLTVRSAPGRGDWDLALVDRPSGRRVVASQSFGSREVLQAWVEPGRAAVVVACRRSGSFGTLPMTTQLYVAPLPRPQPAALVRPLGPVPAGFDVTEDGDVVATPSELARLGVPYRVKIADLGAYDARARLADARVQGRSALPSGRTTYRSYDEIQAELKDLVAKHPGLVRPVKLPHPSFQGREIDGVEIARDVGADDGRPEFLLVALHHAREWPSEEAAMEFAHLLADTKGDARVDSILDHVRTVIVPLVNPDGFISSTTTATVDPSNQLYDNGVDVPAPVCGNLNTCEGIAPPGGILSFRRKNCDGAIPSGAIPCELQWGVDPNRNYGQFWGGAGSSPDPTSQSYRGTGPWSEPETQNIHEWSQSHPVTTLITLHNVAALVLRPPGVKAQGLAPDETALKRLGDAMAAATGYSSQYGYQLYDTSGTTEDWNYAAAGTFGYTIEMGPDGGEFHMPYETGVVKEWEGYGDHAGKGLREALLLAAENAGDPGFHSVVAGRAPAGRVLRLHKDFTTATQDACSAAVTGAPLSTGQSVCVGSDVPAQQIPDHLDYTTVVPASGTFEWHVTPSTRPFVAKAGGVESWTLTCSDGGKVVESRSLTIARGQRVDLDLPCGGVLPSAPAVTPGKPVPVAPAKAKAKAKKKPAHRKHKRAAHHRKRRHRKH